MTAKGDRFLIQDGTPVRFFGSQLGTMPKAQLAYTAKRMRRQGINVSRVHGLEFLNDRNGKTSFDHSASGWDRLADGSTIRSTPRTRSMELSATRYCLANRGKEYLVFQSDKGEFTLNLRHAKGTFYSEWLDVNADRTIPGKLVQAGASLRFTTPFPGPAALYLKLVE